MVGWPSDWRLRVSWRWPVRAEQAPPPAGGQATFRDRVDLVQVDVAYDMRSGSGVNGLAVRLEGA